MEACATAHCWGRAIEAPGHEVELQWRTTLTDLIGEIDAMGSEGDQKVAPTASL